MKYSICVFFLLFVGNTYIFSQAKIRKLPTSINHPAINLYAPFVSFDGDAIIFISDNAEDFALTPFFTFRESNSGWKDPVALPKNVFSRLNYIYGFTLSANGKFLYSTTMKAPGVGGYDIWVSELKGSTWSEPKNFGAPINTKAHEASPTLTPDGNTMYFMRCGKMDQKKAEDCKLFMVSKKVNGQWDEPIELPASLNTGNSQTPRIMADGETLIFSSDKMSGKKGGMDLYMSRFKNGQWSVPKPLDFINTEKDDQYVSVAALGRYLLRDSPGARKSELVEYLIPSEIRPRGVMKVQGSITDPNGASIPSYISAVDLNTGKRVYSGRPLADGSFTIYLLEGTKYELSIDPEQSHITFYTKQFDLTTEMIPQIEKVSATLKPVTRNDEIPLDAVHFKPNSNELLPSSFETLKKVARLIKSNPQLKFEIHVLLAGYVEDSVRSHPDLTEVLYNSITSQITDIDSLGQLYKRDTTIIKTMFHNNRTSEQGKSVVNYLISQGVDQNSLRFFGNARPEDLPEKRKTSVVIHVRDK